MHESREKRSLSLLRSGRVRRRARSRSRSAVFAAPICADYGYEFTPTRLKAVRDTPTQFTAVSKTVKRVELGSPRRIIRIQIHETTGQT
jgi:hypothetical protein